MVLFKEQTTNTTVRTQGKDVPVWAPTKTPKKKIYCRHAQKVQDEIRSERYCCNLFPKELESKKYFKSFICSKQLRTLNSCHLLLIKECIHN